MSVNHTRTPSGDAPQDSDTPMFAPIPSWERGRKRRGARRAEVSNSAAAPITNDEVGHETAMSADGDAPFMAPQTRTVVRRNGSVAPAAIAVGLIALAALAAAGWYATRPADTTMTPGATPATAIATAPPASTGPSAMAANTPPPSAADTTATTPSSSSTTTTTSHRAVAMHTARAATPVVRSHSTTSRSATSAAVNTGATLSQTPAGATPSTPSSAMPPPAATAPPVTAPPVTAMPAPAPWTVTPNVSQTPVNPSAPSTSTTPSTAAPPPPQ